MPGIAQISLAFLNAITCGAIGAVAYKIIYQNKDRLNEKIENLKAENKQLYVKIYVLERVCNEWEIAWINQFNEKREMGKCPE